MTVSQSSIDIRIARPSRVTPALFTRMSILPKSSRICAPTSAPRRDRQHRPRMFRCVRARLVQFIGCALGVFFAATDTRDPRAFTRETDSDCMPNPPPAPVTIAADFQIASSGGMLRAARKLSIDHDRERNLDSCAVSVCRYSLARSKSFETESSKARASFRCFRWKDFEPRAPDPRRRCGVNRHEWASSSCEMPNEALCVLMAIPKRVLDQSSP